MALVVNGRDAKLELPKETASIGWGFLHKRPAALTNHAAGEKWHHCAEVLAWQVVGPPPALEAFWVHGASRRPGSMMGLDKDENLVSGTRNQCWILCCPAKTQACLQRSPEHSLPSRVHRPSTKQKNLIHNGLPTESLPYSPPMSSASDNHSQGGAQLPTQRLRLRCNHHWRRWMGFRPQD